MHLYWAKCAHGSWCQLERVTNLHLPANGIYVIWKPGHGSFVPSQTIRVGQGDIARCLDQERLDPAVAAQGPGLLVTWATVGLLSLDGVELYLTQQLRPLVRARYPIAVPIEVNLPIAA